MNILRFLFVFTLTISALFSYCLYKTEEASSRDNVQQEEKGSEPKKIRKITKPVHEHSQIPKEGRIELTKESLELLGVETAKVEIRKPVKLLHATAEIQFNANRLFHIGPRVSGRVVGVFADLGEEVRQGQRLALIDSVELGKAISDYLTFKTSVEVHEAHFNREQRLWEKRVSSEKEMLDAKAAYLQAKAEFEAAENSLHLLGLSEQDILDLKSQTHSTTAFPILSPFGGTVVEKHTTLGEMTDPAVRLFTVADLKVLWIMLDIYEKDLAKINPGQDVNISVAAYPEKYFQGKIAYISDVMDERTRTIKVRVEIDNSERKLKPGMFATARISMGEEGNGTERLTIPRSAIETYENKKVVFVSLGGSTFQMREVQAGEEFDTQVEVLGGLKEGEEIVTKGGFYLKSELLKEMMVHEH
jgi:cobalt-zinc-cadmium efflux system membrane fusion protein